jgi:AMMECR1 domain-containing protein
MVMLVDNKEELEEEEKLMWRRESFFFSQGERCQTLSSTVFPQVQVGCQDGSCELLRSMPLKAQIRKENQRNPENNPLENVF